MTRPWRWDRRARRLSARLPAETAGAVLGDLLEEYTTRLQHGRWRAEWWLVGEIRSLGHAYRRGAHPGRAWRIRSGELSQTVRALRRAPWYALTLACVIALGMALGATVFAIVDGALFHPLPYRDADRLFAVTVGHAKLPDPLRSYVSISPAEFREWSVAVPEVRLTAFSDPSRQVVGVRDSVQSAQIDPAFFDVIGMRPAVGGFDASDFDTVSPLRPALITHGFWHARFAGDLAAVGRSLMDEKGRGIRIAGILPADFVFPWVADRRFVPVLLTPRVDGSPLSRNRSLKLLARPGPSVTDDLASARLAAAVATWAAAQPVPSVGPDVDERTRIRRGPYDRAGLEPIREPLTRGLTDKAWAVFGVAAALMLLACLNFTSLAIARIRDRRRNLALRRSLGAGYGDLVRLVALENTAIVVMGAAAGIVGAYVLLPITLRLIGGSYLVVLKAPAIDVRVLGFTALAAIVCIGCVTAFSARSAMRASFQNAIAPRDRGRLSIVTFEVAVALVIAVGGALVAGSFMRLWREDPGFDVRDTVLVSMAGPPGASAAQIEGLIADISRIPGVMRAGGAAHPILERAFNGSVFDHPVGFSTPAVGSGFSIESIPVTHGYLDAAGLRRIDGRFPTDAEFLSGSPVIVVSELTAKRYWPAQRAVGQSLLYKGRPFTVVGVVADGRYVAFDYESGGEIYWPVAATSQPFAGNVVIRLDARGRPLLSSVMASVTRSCPTCWVRSGAMLTDVLSTSVQARTFSAWLFSMFGIAALLIAGVGILGLVAMTTTRRTKEIGIRMALGATVSTVTLQIVREHLWSVAIGLAVGGLIAAALVRFVAAYLYKTPVYDPWSWAAAVVALLLVSTLGALIPSHRASRVDPVRALRVD